MNENAENFMHFLMSLELKIINVHCGCCLIVKSSLADLDPVFKEYPDIEVYHSIKYEYHYFIVR